TPTRLFSTRVSSSGCNIAAIVPKVPPRRSVNRPAEGVTQRVLLDAVHRKPPAVELDHGQPLPVAPLQLGDAGDVDLGQREPQLGPQPGQLLAGDLAEMAVAGDVERERLHAATVAASSSRKERAVASSSAGTPNGSVSIGSVWPASTLASTGRPAASV